jgi:hypothetical protein
MTVLPHAEQVRSAAESAGGEAVLLATEEGSKSSSLWICCRAPAALA